VAETISSYNTMVVADLVVMVLHSAKLQIATRSKKWLHQFLPSKRRQQRDNDCAGEDVGDNDDGGDEMKLESGTTTLISGSASSINHQPDVYDHHTIMSAKGANNFTNVCLNYCRNSGINHGTAFRPNCPPFGNNW
jgi:hypothetical protein